MAFKYATVLMKNPKTKLMEVRARAVSDKVTLESMANDIASKTTLTYPDLLAALRSVMEHAVIALRNGNILELGDLGWLYPTLSSEAAKKEDSFNTAMIRCVKLRYRPSRQMKEVVNSDLSFVKTITKKQEEAGKKAATEHQNAALQAQAVNAGEDDGE